MLVDRLTEELITDNREIQDGLLIPVRRLPVARIKCTCSHCQRLNSQAAWILENPGDDGQHGPYTIPQLGGKVTTKLDHSNNANRVQ